MLVTEGTLVRLYSPFILHIVCTKGDAKKLCCTVCYNDDKSFSFLMQSCFCCLFMSRYVFTYFVRDKFYVALHSHTHTRWGVTLFILTEGVAIQWFLESHLVLPLEPLQPTEPQTNKFGFISAGCRGKKNKTILRCSDISRPNPVQTAAFVTGFFLQRTAETRVWFQLTRDNVWSQLLHTTAYLATR